MIRLRRRAAYRAARPEEIETSTSGTDGVSGPDVAAPHGLSHGLRWSASNVVVGRALSMISTIVLARILIPEDFGVFAVALVVYTGLISVNDFGATNAIVRWPGDPARAARTATTLTWAGSLVWFTVAVLAAPALASWSRSPGAVRPMQVFALGVVIDGVAAIPGALLTRGFHQDRRTIADFSSLLLSIAVSVGLAFAGAGVWALVIGRLVGNACATAVVLVVAPARPGPGWNRDDARSILRFGLPLVGASALVFAMANADTLVIARALGAGAALGFYALAFNLSSWPLNVLSGTLRRVSLPLFATHQHDDRKLAGSILGTLQLVGAVAALPCMLLAALALWAVTFIYGDKWAPAASALTFLAILGWVRVLAEMSWDALIATGRTRRVLAAQAVWTAALIPALVLGVAADGIRGVAIAHALVAIIIVLPTFGFALHRMGAPFGSLASRVARPVLSALVFGLAGWGIAEWIGDPAILVLAVAGSLMTAAFVAVVWRPSSVRAGWNDVLGRDTELQTA